MTKKVFIITGDYSGDLHASKLVSELKFHAPDIVVEGVGGINLERAGIKLLLNQDKMNTMGITPKTIFNHYLIGQKIISYLKNEFRPDLVILIDYGAFNLEISKVLKKNGFKIFYFIPPQIWASRKWRLKTIKKNIDKVFTIFPFEKEFYEKEGINSVYAGHPLLNELPPAIDRDLFFEKHSLDKNKKLIGVFPGSRVFEIKFLFNTFLGAVKLIEKRLNNVQFVFSLSQNLPDGIFKTDYKVLKGENHALLSASDALILASGTVALEAALYETPMIIAYKGPFLFYLGYLIVRTIKKACLVNIITGLDIVPEFLMYDANSEKIADKIIEIIEKGAPVQKDGFKKLKGLIGNSHCFETVAKEIIKELKNG